MSDSTERDLRRIADALERIADKLAPKQTSDDDKPGDTEGWSSTGYPEDGKPAS